VLEKIRDSCSDLAILCSKAYSRYCASRCRRLHIGILVTCCEHAPRARLLASASRPFSATSCSVGTLRTHRGTPYAISLPEISRKPHRVQAGRDRHHVLTKDRHRCGPVRELRVHPLWPIVASYAGAQFASSFDVARREARTARECSTATRSARLLCMRPRVREGEPNPVALLHHHDTSRRLFVSTTTLLTTLMTLCT